ncbi:MAG TPA: DUF1080 domain-containing protein [Gemmataceae bacterium]|nr:DUF1080 domain-containing protein [Gemmataceae bacterium]
MRRAIVPLTLAILAIMFSAAQSAEKDIPEGFAPLCNGKDLTGWKVYGGKMESWGVDKGLLFTTGSGGGWLLTDKEYSDFELRLEYRWEKAGGNSGVALRAPLTNAVSTKGIEIQLIDDAGYEKVHKYKLKPTQHTGSIYDVVPPSKLPGKGAGEWNKMRIVAKGRKITVELNGVTVTDANLDDYKTHTEKHPGLLRQKGHLGVQSHGGRVEFRNLLVKPL